MKMNHTNTPNKVLELAAQIRQLTSGICRVGPGPYGFGVSTQGISYLGLTVRLTPDLYDGSVQLLDSDKIMVTVEAFDKKNYETLDNTAVLRFTSDGDAATRLVAETPIAVSRQECDEAFVQLASQELGGQDTGFTKEEALRLDDLHWYEGKTAREIVDFQLFERRLCMPFDRFHEAVESALGRPVWTHEFAIENRLADEYRQRVRAELTGVPAPQVAMECLVDGLGGDDAETITENEGPQQTFHSM